MEHTLYKNNALPRYDPTGSGILKELNFVKKREEKIKWMMGYLGRIITESKIPNSYKRAFKCSQRPSDYPQINDYCLIFVKTPA